jgi:pSer/pThr/pTyr-binding forkhead associated (FHA) protein
VAEIEMAKLILSIGGSVLREITLTKERVTIGRRPDNDIVIEDLAISGEHAVIVSRDNDAFLEDLNSTNGTRVNGQPIAKHFLQDGNVIELAQYRLRFLADSANGDALNDENRLPGLDVRAVTRIKILNGPNAGKKALLSKTLTTIGRDDRVVVIIRKPAGFYLATLHADDDVFINGRTVGSQEHLLFPGDVINLAGTQMEFCVNK